MTRRRLLLTAPLAALAVLVLVIAARTLLFRSDAAGAETETGAREPYLLPIDAEAAALRLSRAVQFPTVSREPGDPATDRAAFVALRAHLETSFPRVHATLDREVIGSGALLYRWRGKDSTRAPVLLVGHMDVVPAEKPEAWSHPPFSGAIADGYIWGRGTLDDKVAVLGILEAAEYLLGQGFVPERSIYFAFGHDEELSGRAGALAIAHRLAQQHVRFAFAVDEGMSIVDGLVPGLDRPAALIGTASKGYLSVRLTARVEGGHSSMPAGDTAVTALTAALARLSDDPLPARVTPPVSEMLDALGPHMSIGYRVLMANRWLFEPFLRASLGSSPSGNAVLRTTTAPTMLGAGVRDNVLPAEAWAVVNFRIHPAESVLAVLEHVEETVDDPRISVEELEDKSAEPFGPVPPGAPGFQLLSRAVHDVYPEVLVAPALFIGAADLRHYRDLSDELYLFHPLWLTSADTARLHGVDERIGVDQYRRYVIYYARLMELAGADST